MYGRLLLWSKHRQHSTMSSVFTRERFSLIFHQPSYYNYEALKEKNAEGNTRISFGFHLEVLWFIVVHLEANSWKKEGTDYWICVSYRSRFLTFELKEKRKNWRTRKLQCLTNLIQTCRHSFENHYPLSGRLS